MPLLLNGVDHVAVWLLANVIRQNIENYNEYANIYSILHIE